MMKMHNLIHSIHFSRFGKGKLKLNVNKLNMDSLTQETAHLHNTKHPQTLVKCLRILLWIKYFFNWSVLCVSGLLGLRRFRGSTLNYSLLLLEEEAGLLYVGARGALYALQASDISSSSPQTVCTDKTHQHLITELARQNYIDILHISYFYSSSSPQFSTINSAKKKKKNVM